MLHLGHFVNGGATAGGVKGPEERRLPRSARVIGALPLTLKLDPLGARNSEVSMVPSPSPTAPSYFQCCLYFSPQQSTITTLDRAEG